jgi:hypothetical protein
MSTSPAAWHPDPTGRHNLRYFDGNKWTDHVTTQTGVQTLDPVQPLASQPVVASHPSALPPLPPAVTAMPSPTMAPASGASPMSSLQVTKAAVVAGVAALAALIGSLSMSWVTGTADFDGLGVRKTLSIDRSTLSSAFDQGLQGGGLYRAFVQYGWILAPIVCALAALLSLGYVRKARAWTIVLALLATLWAIATANALSSTSGGETDKPAAGLFVVIAATAVAFIVAIVARKSTASSQAPA